jgi:AraC family transcriptional regulator, arabinose operon regulatory protein
MDQILFPLITEEEKKLPFIVMSVGVRENQEHIIRPEGYPQYHWLHCSKGSGRLLIGNKEFSISENMGFFFYPGIPHEYYAVTEPWQTHWITFDGYAVNDLLNLLGFNSYDIFYLAERNHIEKFLQDIFISASSQNTRHNFECSSLLYTFLLMGKTHMRREIDNGSHFYYHQLQSVITYIEDNYNKPLALEDMAAVINVTPQHLCRIFKKAYYLTPFVYLTKYRLKKAKECIVSLENPAIKEVALKVGYNDTSYFCAIFKEFEGVTPMKFKHMHKA